MEKIKIPRREKDIMNKVADAMYDHIRALSDSELDDLISGCGKVSTTNCGWWVYRMAPMMRDMAQQQLGFR